MSANTLAEWRRLTPGQRQERFLGAWKTVDGAGSCCAKVSAVERLDFWENVRDDLALGGIPCLVHEALVHSSLPDALGLLTTCQGYWPGIEGVVQALSSGSVPIGACPDNLDWLWKAMLAIEGFACRLPGDEVGIPVYGGYGWLVRQSKDCAQVCEAIGGGKADLNGGLRILQLDSDHAVESERVGNKEITYDPETSAWLRQRLLGCQLSWKTLATREASVMNYPRLPHGRALGGEWELWREQGRGWSSNEVRKAHWHEAEAVKTFAELFADFDVLMFWENHHHSRTGDTLRSAVALARLPSLWAYIVDETGGRSYAQFVFPHLKGLSRAHVLLAKLGMST